MKIKKFILFIFLLLGLNKTVNAANLPNNFVYLHDIDPTITQEIRYAGYHNFIGRPVTGYQAAECILTKPAAVALAKIQQELNKKALGLKVYDCYRPQMAVDDFIVWSSLSKQQQMKAEFYPRVNKKQFFELGYVAAQSGHTRGSTVDLTIIPYPATPQAKYISGQKLVACFMPYYQRFQDNSIDMGTGFDCMDELAHVFNKSITKTAYENRMLLRKIMQKYGFVPYNEEWWHFTLDNESFPNTYFNFAIKK